MTDLDNLDLSDDNEEQVNYLEQFVGEGKKYKSVNELAKAYAHADLHIRELTAERSEQKAINEILEELRKRPASMEPPPTHDNGLGEPVEVNVAEVVQRELDKRLKEQEEALTRKQQEELRRQNGATSLNKLIEHYGSEEEAVRVLKKINKQSKALGQSLQELGKSDPEAFFQAVTKLAPTDAGPSTPGLDKSVSAPLGTNGQLTWSACQKLRKENPRMYNSPEFRARMAEEAARRGQDFFNS